MKKNRILSLVLAMIMLLAPLGDMVLAAEEIEKETITITYQVNEGEGYFGTENEKKQEEEVIVDKPTELTDALVKEKAPKLTAKVGYEFSVWEKVKDKDNTYKAKMAKTYKEIVYQVDNKEGYFEIGGQKAQEAKINLDNHSQITEDLVKKNAPKVTAKEGYRATGKWTLVKDNIYKAEMEKLVKYDRIIYRVKPSEGYFEAGGGQAQEVIVKLDKEEELTEELVKKNAPQVKVKEGYKFLDSWTHEKENIYQAKIEEIKTEDVTYLIDKDGGYFLEDGKKVDKIVLEYKEGTIITDSLVKEKAPKAYAKDNYKLVGDWEKVAGQTNTYRMKVSKIEDGDIVYRVDFTKGYIDKFGKELEIFIEQVASGITVNDDLAKKLAPKVVARKGYEITDEWVKVKESKNTYELKINKLEDQKITYTIDFTKGYFLEDGKKVDTFVDFVAAGVPIDDTVIKNLAPKAYAREGYELVDGWKKIEGKDYSYEKELKKAEAPLEVIKYSLGVNVRNKDNKIVDYLDRGEMVKGEIRGSYLYFNRGNEELKVHLAFLQDSNPGVKLYVKGGSNIREGQSVKSNAIAYYSKGTVIYGINKGAWTEFTIKEGQKAYIASNRLTRTPTAQTFISKGVNVRDLSGNIIGYYRRGALFNGFASGDAIKLKYNNKNATVYRPFTEVY